MTRSFTSLAVIARGPRLPRRGIAGALAVLVASAALALASPAAAQPANPPVPATSASCTVRVLHLLPEQGAIDERLEPLRKLLTTGPFAAFKTIKLLETRELQLPQGTSRSMDLPNGEALRLTFKEKLLEGKDRLRLRMHAVIRDPKKKPDQSPKPRPVVDTLYVIANGGTQPFVRTPFQGGALALGVTCQAQ